jgi:hypothetical protein
MKPNKKRSVFRSALTEIMSIVIGVLLALAVNEWNENRVHKKRADEAIQNIIKEIESNIKFLNIVNANNKATIELLKGENKPTKSESNSQFVPGLQIQDTAWKTMQSTGVSEYIQYSILYEISNIYSLQEIYKKLGYQLVQNFSSNRALIAAIKQSESTSFDNKLFLTDMELIEQVEKALLESYKKVLEQFKNKK